MTLYYSFIARMYSFSLEFRQYNTNQYITDVQIITLQRMPYQWFTFTSDICSMCSMTA